MSQPKYRIGERVQLKPRPFGRLGEFMLYKAIVVEIIGTWRNRDGTVAISRWDVTYQISPIPDDWSYRVETYHDGDLTVAEDEIACSMDILATDPGTEGTETRRSMT